MKFALAFCTAALLIGALVVANRALTDSIATTAADLRWLLLAIVIIPPVYFVPSIVAASVEHPRAAMVFWLNLSLGWTIAGWVAAMMWAVSAPGKLRPYTPLIAMPGTSPAPTHQTTVRLTPDMAARKIEELVAMKAEGRISEAEYTESCRLVLAPLMPA